LLHGSSLELKRPLSKFKDLVWGAVIMNFLMIYSVSEVKKKGKKTSPSDNIISTCSIGECFYILYGYQIEKSAIIYIAKFAAPSSLI
jgi:hypothetical protein